MEFDLFSAGLLIVAGLISGIMNTLVSSGSAITLPALMFMGMDGAVANATNRVSLVFSFAFSVTAFERKNAINWKVSLKLLPALVTGTVLGALEAEYLSLVYLDRAIETALILALGLVLAGARRFIVPQPDNPCRVGFRQQVMIFLTGLWLGFIVLDGGTYLLMVIVLGIGMDVSKANPVKAVMVLASTAISLFMFAAHHLVNWEAGLWLSVGSMIGGYAGAQLALNERSRKWIYRLLVGIISTEIVMLMVKWFG